MSKKRGDVSFPLYITKNLLKRIEDYRDFHYLRLVTRNAAIAELIIRGLWGDSVNSESLDIDHWKEGERVSFALYIDTFLLENIESYRDKHYLRLTTRNATIIELILKGLMNNTNYIDFLR